MSRKTLPLQLTQKGAGTPVLLLGGIDITNFVAAGGLSIDYATESFGPAVPTVTITFGWGALDLDLDVELLENLLAAAKVGAK